MRSLLERRCKDSVKKRFIENKLDLFALLSERNLVGVSKMPYFY
jgi:hypothetical protein